MVWRTPSEKGLPVLFECSLHRDASIASMLVSPMHELGCEWNVNFIRAFNDCEVDVVVSFFSLFHSNIPSREGANGSGWCLNRKGVFDTRSYYNALQPPMGVTFPWKSIWGIKAPRRVSFFVWMAAWGRILTSDSLMRRGYVLASRCCLYWRSLGNGGSSFMHTE
jgi:hypothetical protein